MRPDAEADETGSDQRQDVETVPNERDLRDCGHHHAHQTCGRNEDDVDFRMAEEPEEVLPQHRIAAAKCIEEGPVERSFDF